MVAHRSYIFRVLDIGSGSGVLSAYAALLVSWPSNLSIGFIKFIILSTTFNSPSSPLIICCTLKLVSTESLLLLRSITLQGLADKETIHFSKNDEVCYMTQRSIPSCWHDVKTCSCAIGGYPGRSCRRRHPEGSYCHGFSKYRFAARTQPSLQRASCAVHLPHPQRLPASTCSLLPGPPLAERPCISERILRDQGAVTLYHCP